MNHVSMTNAVLVSLPMPFVEAILAARSALDDDAAVALHKSLEIARKLDRPASDQPSHLIPTPERGKYAAEFLGVRFAADTLAGVFRRIVEMMHDVAPEALASLSEIRTRGRRLVAMNPCHIHPYSPHLPVLQTDAGWWISKNISQDQLVLALRKTCEVSRLTFGNDIKFPLR